MPHDTLTAPRHPFTRPPAQSGRLAALDREIERARRTLLELWRTASPADRLFAVDRLLRDTILPQPLGHELQRTQDAVRDAWVTARVAAHLRMSVPTDASVAALQLSLVERDRDRFLEDNDLFQPLFVAAESFLRPMSGARTLKSLLREREVARAELVPILPPLDDVDDELGDDAATEDGARAT